MIAELTNETEKLIAQNKNKEYQIKDFQNVLIKIENILLNFKANKENLTKETMFEIQIWLNKYQEYLEECEKIAEKLSITPYMNEEDCKRLLQYITIFNERKQEIQIDSPNIVSQISNLHNILHNLNFYYQNMFQTKENLIEPTSLPNKKDDHYTLQEYLAYIRTFFARNLNTEETINKIKEEQNLEREFLSAITNPVLPETPIENVTMPTFLEEYQKDYDNQEILKRKKAALIYQEKLQNELKKIPQDSSMFNMINQEITRLKNISEEQFANLRINLNIPNIDMESTSILAYLKLQEAFPNEAVLKGYPTLLKSEIEIPAFMQNRKKYELKDRTKEPLTSIIKKFSKTIAVACALSLITSNQDYQQVLGNEKENEEYLDFDNFINFGDEIILKQQAYAYNRANVFDKTSLKTIPLYSLDTPRTVSKIFLIKDNKIIEVHSYEERNFYLEKGYIILSVYALDGYYNIKDTETIKKEVHRIQ